MLAWTFLTGEKSLASAKNEPQFLSHPTHSPLTIEILHSCPDSYSTVA